MVVVNGPQHTIQMRWIIVWSDASKSAVAGFAAFRLAGDSGVPHVYLHELQIASDWRQKVCSRKTDARYGFIEKTRLTHPALNRIF